MAQRVSTVMYGSQMGGNPPGNVKEQAVGNNDQPHETVTQASALSESPDDASLELLQLEQERDRRFKKAEQELLDTLENDDTMSDHVRKRQLTRLFDRFRNEYMQLSTRFRENLRLQHKIMDNCQAMKNQLVMSALRIRTAKKVQDEERENLIYYREECEHAWKAAKVCAEREKDAMRIIDELKSEIEGLQEQVKSLLQLSSSGSSASNGKYNENSSKGAIALPVQSALNHGASLSGQPGLSPVCSPSKRVRPLTDTASYSPSKSAVNHRQLDPSALAVPPQLSFDEWKQSTRIWSPSGLQQPKAKIPTLLDVSASITAQEIARCVSVPSLQPTAMERAVTATAWQTASPSKASTSAASWSPSRRRRHDDRNAPRAVTAMPSKRIANALPNVLPRKPA